ncbi:tetratricopeptide repeat protein [Endozoicomonas numazuensis]|nr:tetratricopeptide repeat protein [Endozoicomonas numazuensis]
MAEAVNCQYHKSNPAVWHCGSCQKHYGECCVPVVPEGYDQPLCTLCNHEMIYLGAAHSAEPFWLKINDFFLYPVRISSMAFLAVCILIGFVMPYTGPFILPLSILLMCVLTKYSLQIIESVSLGDWEPPNLSEAFSSEGMSLFFKQMGVFLVAGLALYFLSSLGVFVVLGAVALMLLGLPASMMILAREHTLTAAVNPIKIAFVVSAIGWPYLLLYFFLIVLYGGPGYFIGGQEEVSSLFAAASSLLGGYFSFVMCAMMGYCLYQYQSELGYAAEMESEEGISEEEYQSKKALSDGLIFMREGREEEALKITKQALERDRSDIQLNKRFFRLLLLSAPDQALIKFGEKYIQRLLILRRDHEAADVYLDMKGRMKSYLSPVPGERYRLAEALAQKGKVREAVGLLFNLHKLFPDYQQLPEAYMLIARLLSENMNNDEQANKYLEFIIQKFPDHRIAKEAWEYRKVIESLSATTEA